MSATTIRKETRDSKIQDGQDVDVLRSPAFKATGPNESEFA